MTDYRITSENIIPNSNDDCYLSPTDPLNELKVITYLAGINGHGRLQEYRAQNQIAAQGSNISLTGNEKAKIQKEHNIRPGTPEWFKLWFSRPYLTGESPYES